MFAVFLFFFFLPLFRGRLSLSGVLARQRLLATIYPGLGLQFLRRRLPASADASNALAVGGPSPVCLTNNGPLY